MSFQLDPDLDTGTRTGFVDVPDNLSSTTELIVGNDFHNPLISEDADANGNIQALDVLVIVNYLNANPDPNTPVNSSFYLDVSNEGTVSALDVLQVVNYLNSHPQGAGLTGQSLVSQGLVAQGLAAPQEAATASSFKKSDASSTTVDSAIELAPSTEATTDTAAADSFADSLSISAADVADLDEELPVEVAFGGDAIEVGASDLHAVRLSCRSPVCEAVNWRSIPG
jgi:DNA uptake protein ComE-like DNA-binding protein